MAGGFLTSHSIKPASNVVENKDRLLAGGFLTSHSIKPASNVVENKDRLLAGGFLYVTQHKASQ